MQRRKLGEILIALGYATQECVDEGLKLQKELPERLGKIMIQNGWLSEDDLGRALASQTGVAFVELENLAVAEQATLCVPQNFAERSCVLPLRIENRRLLLAVADPTDFKTLEEAEKFSGFPVEIVAARRTDIQLHIRKLYEAENLVREVSKAFGGEAAAVKQASPPENAPIVSLADTLISQAVQEGASDIHIEPMEQEVRVRFRVDGLLRRAFSFPLHVHIPLVSRLKIMGEMDIAERRLPQDGRASWRGLETEVDLRISSIPTIWGEKLVLRILRRSIKITSWENLDFSVENFQRFQELCRRSCGLVLLTGPTGSGKSTTLYAALSALSNVEKNIVTIEDPVEYRLAGVNQIQVNQKAGLDFSQGLRAILRQDPDVIMVGEIRDRETAAIAVRAALTGHLVFSTLHTNDAAGAVVRLLDMGVEPFLLASALSGVIAQRLVRRSCTDCRVSYAPSEQRCFLPANMRPLTSGLVLQRGRGCPKCAESGYRGRMALQEALVIDDSLRELIRAGKDGEALKKAVAASGCKSLYEDGLEKVLRGETTIEEVRRVVYTDSD